MKSTPNRSRSHSIMTASSVECCVLWHFTHNLSRLPRSLFQVVDRPESKGLLCDQTQSNGQKLAPIGPPQRRPDNRMMWIDRPSTPTHEQHVPDSHKPDKSKPIWLHHQMGFLPHLSLAATRKPAQLSRSSCSFSEHTGLLTLGSSSGYTCTISYS